MANTIVIHCAANNSQSQSVQKTHTTAYSLGFGMPRYILIIPLILVACTPTVDNKLLSEECSLKPETGHCRAAIQKYFFDETRQRCRQFIWGGCGGVVPFDTKKQCNTLCSSATDTALFTKLSSSLSQWQNTKLAKGDTYRYLVQFSSWVGFGNETTIGIVNDAVTYRKYRSWDDEKNEITRWTEDSIDTLGSHRDGASVKTVDELYDDCQEILVSKDNGINRIHLSFDDNGIIHSCLFAPKNCADDCSSGIRVNNLIFSN